MTDTALWPTFDVPNWAPTKKSFHLYTQMLGKMRLALSPSQPNWMFTALLMSARGVTTGPIPWHGASVEASPRFITRFKPHSKPLMSTARLHRSHKKCRILRRFMKITGPPSTSRQRLNAGSRQPRQRQVFSTNDARIFSVVPEFNCGGVRSTCRSFSSTANT